MHEIDEIFVRFSDTSGSSPDFKFAAGAGRSPSYSPPDDKGNFITPVKRGNPKSLFSEEVRTSFSAQFLSLIVNGPPFYANLYNCTQGAAEPSSHDSRVGKDELIPRPQVIGNNINKSACTQNFGFLFLLQTAFPHILALQSPGHSQGSLSFT